ncbi:MAG: hypothetical protein ABI442_20080 [Gemmatimonadaceae bacterium]
MYSLVHSSRDSRPLRSFATLVLAVAVSTCFDAPSPGAPTPAKNTGPTRIALAATFSRSAAAVFAQRNEFAVVNFDHVRVILMNSWSDIVKDTTIAFTPTSPDFTLDLTIDGAALGDYFPVELQ